MLQRSRTSVYRTFQRCGRLFAFDLRLLFDTHIRVEMQRAFSHTLSSTLVAGRLMSGERKMHPSPLVSVRNNSVCTRIH